MSKTAHFVLRLEMPGVAPAVAVSYAKLCEQILRDRAPAGVEVQPLEFRGSRISPRAERFSERVREALARDAERERDRRVAAGEAADRGGDLAPANGARDEEPREERVAWAREREQEILARRAAEAQLKAAASLAGEEIDVLE
jgi:hypothetical protein